MSLEGAIQNINDIAQNLLGIRSTNDYPPEQTNAFPFAIAFASSGRADGGGLGQILSQEEHEIIVEIHVARKDLPRDVEKSVGFYTLFKDALIDDPTLTAEVDEIAYLDYTFGPMSWGAEENNTIGYRFTVGVRMNC